MGSIFVSVILLLLGLVVLFLKLPEKLMPLFWFKKLKLDMDIRGQVKQ